MGHIFDLYDNLVVINIIIIYFWDLVTKTKKQKLI